MFDRLNELARDLVREASRHGARVLSAEVYSYLPVSDSEGAAALRAQLKLAVSSGKLHDHVRRAVDKVNHWEESR